MLDSLLACAGSGLVTGMIATFRLYPRIPNISIVYLLIVLALATTRGRYAAMLTAVVAFLSFDFFIVPPLYTFVICHVEEWIALFVFLIALQRPDLLLLDLLLPGMSGLEVCRQVRAMSSLPIIVLSVKDREWDKVEALDLGADDYVAKPFGMDEVLARVRVARVAWRRSPASPSRPFASARSRWISPSGRCWPTNTKSR